MLNFYIFFFVLASAIGHASATETNLNLQSVIADLKELASDSILVEAVRERNKNSPFKWKTMTNEKWKTYSVRDPALEEFMKSSAALKMKAWAKPYVTEVFLSAADGTKVAFLNKTTNWSHKGKPKHEVPMSGNSWQGPLELDESTGKYQVQLAVPVDIDGKPAGSLVAGVSIVLWEKQKK